MNKIKDLTVDDLEHLIEQKVVEILGDPDSGLDLRQEFKEELSRRLKISRSEGTTSRGGKKVCLKSNGLKRQ